MRLLLILLIAFPFSHLNGQTDSSIMRSIYNEALTKGKSYEDLRELCKNIGARLSGSSEAEMAIRWGESKLNSYEFDKVYLQPIMVPHWERGTKESGWYTINGEIHKVNILALGGSIGTNGILESEIIEFKSLEDLKTAKQKDVENKIVFINQPMNEQHINTFRAYGGCYPVRGNGAIEASRLGAKAVIIRSLGIPIDEHPHTGSMYYNDSVKKIPAAAISTKDAEQLSEIIQSAKVKFTLELDCRSYPDKASYNVIGEITGSKFPNQIITVGGHLDSWDTGEGAHDDGAGIIHSMEALRILKEINYKPINTIRVVFFMNEENGNMGGKTYASLCKEKNEVHIAAVESDRGGFSPRGFHCDGNEKQIAMLKSFAKEFNNYEVFEFGKGYGGVDIGPLKEEFKEIPLFGLVPDSQRYFDFHHSPNDVFENVNKRELELGCAAVASILYLLDKNL